MSIEPELRVPRELQAASRYYQSPLRARVWGDHLVTVLRQAMMERVSGGSPFAVVRSMDVGLRQAIRDLAVIRDRERRLTSDLAACDAPADTRLVLRAHIFETVLDPFRRREDLRALDRWLDGEALLDRELERASGATQRARLCLDIMTRAFADVQTERLASWVEETHMVPYLMDLAEGAQRAPIREEALLALEALLRAAPNVRSLGDKTRVRAWALDRNEPVWVQVAALRALSAWDTGMASGAVLDRFLRRAEGDDFLVRRNALRVASDHLRSSMSVPELALAGDDPSDHVRQGLADALLAIGTDEAWRFLSEMVQDDPEPRVRGWALRAMTQAVASDDDHHHALLGETLLRVLRYEKDELPLRIAVDALPTLATGGVISPLAPFVDCLSELTTRDLVIGERATATLRSLELLEDPEALFLAERLARQLPGVREGKSLQVDLVPNDANDRVLMRALRHVGRGDLQLAARRQGNGYEIIRGERRRRRPWRILHELTHVAPDKRSGYVHTQARVTEGTMVVPPVVLGELTPTPVPGERRFVKQAGGWGPFLMRVDDLLAACFSRVPYRIVTSAGVVEIRS
ncbi:MAG: HEAT repeat domain-containing protein, partial [Myxococcales bacterium]|nr:HEAT repeat domain-containing protein [Myxococcales bacterium]